MIAAQGRCLAVPPPLGRALLPLQGRRPEEKEVRACLAGDKEWVSEWVSPEQALALVSLLCGTAGKPSGRTRRRALWLRIPLIPGSLTAAVAFRLRHLASWRGLAGLAALGMAGYLAPGLIVQPPASATFGSVLPALLLFLATALWHEFGHAAALAREGYPPGGIGAGLLFVIPVLFADVTAIGALSKAGRARVDLAGVCYQFGLGGILFFAGVWIPAARTASLFALFAVAWSLLPFIRSDGYWLLCDLLGVSNLNAPVLPGRSRGLRVFLGLFRLANAAFLVLVVWVVARRVGGWVGQLSGLLGAAWDGWTTPG